MSAEAGSSSRAPAAQPQNGPGSRRRLPAPEAPSKAAVTFTRGRRPAITTAAIAELHVLFSKGPQWLSGNLPRKNGNKTLDRIIKKYDLKRDQATRQLKQWRSYNLIPASVKTNITIDVDRVAFKADLVQKCKALRVLESFISDLPTPTLKSSFVLLSDDERASIISACSARLEEFAALLAENAATSLKECEKLSVQYSVSIQETRQVFKTKIVGIGSTIDETQRALFACVLDDELHAIWSSAMWSSTEKFDMSNDHVVFDGCAQDKILYYITGWLVSKEFKYGCRCSHPFSMVWVANNWLDLPDARVA
ncbi:hypothetical protein RI054_05g27450 [Pseudoscourfieldia marina]